MKNKYELFNDIKLKEESQDLHTLSKNEKEEIFNNLAKKININDDEYVKNNVSISKNKHKKNYKKIAIASVLCLSISTLLLTNEKVWALVSNIGKQIESYLGRGDNEYKGYKEPINQEAEDKGIKLNIYEALLDDGNILLSMNIDYSNFDESTLKNSGLLKKQYYLPTATVYMDGKKFVETGGSTINNEIKENSQEFLTELNLQRVDTDGDNQADITDYQILENIDPDKEYDIKIVFDQVGVQKRGLIPKITNSQFEFIKGNWEFNFKINGKKIMGETKVYNINKEIEIDDENFKALINIKQLRVSPISVKLTYTTKMGKEYEFENRDINIELLDQDGDIINAGGGGGGNEEQTYMEWNLEGNLENDKKLESIKILPYQYYRENGSKNPKKHHTIKYEEQSITIDLN